MKLLRRWALYVAVFALSAQVAIAQTATPSPTSTPGRTPATISEVVGGATRNVALTLTASTAGGTAGGYAFVNTSRELLVIENASGGPATVTITAYDTLYNISQVVADGTTRIFGPFGRVRYGQKTGTYSGMVLFGLSTNHASLKYGIIKLPSS